MAMPQPMYESPRSPRAVDSYGPRIAFWMRRKLGMTLGPWQAYALERVLEHDSNGDLLAALALVSVARQNGKSVIVRALVGWLLDEGIKLPAFSAWDFALLAAHDAKQARIPYDYIRRDLVSWADDITWRERKDARREIKRATLFSGIEYNGVRVDVASAREGSARGISPGLICFDEVLTQTNFNMYEVLSPAQSAIRNALMLMTSTMGFADSVVLRAMYERLVRQATGADAPDDSFIGLYWGAPDDDIGLDWDGLYQANPALHDGRLSRKAIETEYGVLPKGSWIRERLNRWADERVDAPFNLQAWGACRQAGPLDPARVSGDYVLSLDVTADWSEGAIIVSALRGDGKVGVEVHRHLEGRAGAPLAASQFTEQIDNLAAKLKVQSIGYSASSALAPALERHKALTNLPYVAVNGAKMNGYCEDFAESVLSRRLVHNDPYLDSQVAKAQRRYVGNDGGWRWAISQGAINGLISATIATSIAARESSPVQVFI